MSIDIIFTAKAPVREDFLKYKECKACIAWLCNEPVTLFN